MDDLAHQCPRKRKQDNDDCPDQAAADATGAGPDRESCNPPLHTPRRPWITEADDNWDSPTPPQVSPPLSLTSSPKPSSSKRPRLDALDTSLHPSPKRHHQPRRSANKMLPSPLATATPAPTPTSVSTVGTTIRQGSDLEDIGVVPTADPGPSSGSLLSRDRHEQESQSSPCQSPHTQNQQPEGEGDAVRIHPAVESPNIDLCSPHVPALRPLINRLTLKELELDVILRNPVIRHDLLFDPGLQFRPRRKREKFERYWNAVWEEVQTGCTCLTLDAQGDLHHTKICICSRFPHSTRNMAEQFKAEGGKVIYSLRMPSRIPALLLEVLEVMVFVIQPLSNTAVYTDPNAIREQAQEHSAHAAYLRSIFDPALIAQELKHKVFDPSGLFVRIGQTLKHHCAPMRDRAVEEMVQMAQRPGPEAFKAVRACLELLELMKLDIANHQLTQLRPWLLRNTGIFEVKAFKIRFGNNPSLHNTRMWLDAAHDALLERKTPIPHPSYPAGCIRYLELRRNHQIYLSVLKGIVDLIFDIQEAHPFASLSNNNNSNSNFVSSPESPISPINASRLASNLVPLPETLYLDKSRLLHLSTEAVSTTALYMFILLFRQLVFSSSEQPSGFAHPIYQPRNSTNAIKVSPNDMARLKREIRDIGPVCLGTCFEDDREGEGEGVGAGVGMVGVGVSTSPSTPVQESGDNIGNTQNNANKKSEKDLEQIRSSKQNLVLQVAMRASDIRRRDSSPSSSTYATYSSSTPSFSFCTPRSDSDLDGETRIGLEAPDPALLAIAQRWADTNMKPGSALTRLLHKRMRDAVFDAVVGVAYPSRETTQAAVSAGRSLGVDWAASGILAGMHLGANGNANTNGNGNLGSGGASTCPASPLEPHPQCYPSVTQTTGMESMTDEIQRLAEDIARLALIHLNTHLPLYESQGFFTSRTV